MKKKDILVLSSYYEFSLDTEIYEKFNGSNWSTLRPLFPEFFIFFGLPVEVN